TPTSARWCNTEKGIPMFEDFQRYLVSSATRTRGKPPRPATLASAEMRLRSAMRIGGFSISKELATCVKDRAAWCGLLDKMYAQLAPVTVQGNVVTLRQWGDWLVASGKLQSHAVEASDGPRAVPQKPIVVYTGDEVA